MDGTTKKFRNLAIVFSVIAAVLFTCYAVMKAVSYPYASVGLLVVGGILAVAAIVCWILFGVKMKKIRDEQRFERQALEEFDEWLKVFEPLTKTAVELIRAQQGGERFTKFGGVPVVPPSFEWPTRNGKPLPFLLQIDFSEINGEGQLKNFPTAGLLYLFVEEFVTEDLDLQYPSKILFFEGEGRLEPAKAPHGLQTTYRQIFVAPEVIKTYPAPEDSGEAFDLYCARPHGGMDDGYDALCRENEECHLIGGWPSHLQYGGFIKQCAEGDGEKWVLLMQIKSEITREGDGDFMWGDDGVIYLYIREKDLIARNFDDIKIDMQCY